MSAKPPHGTRRERVMHRLVLLALALWLVLVLTMPTYLNSHP